jgi:copper chaperone
MKKYILNVPDMSCEHCRTRISKKLEEMNIKNFSVNLGTKQVSVETDDVGRLISELDDIGYAAKIEKEI